MDTETPACVVPTRKLKILVAEDEEALLALVTELLEDDGHTVVKAQDGAEALKLFHEHRREIDLVILDMMLPRIGGGEVLLEMKKLDPHVQVTMTSGYDGEDIRCNYPDDACCFLQKPFRQTDLRHAVATCTERQSSKKHR